jgi:hypothetical protein
MFLCESRIDSLVHQLDNLGFGLSHFFTSGRQIDDSHCFVILADCDGRRVGTMSCCTNNQGTIILLDSVRQQIVIQSRARPFSLRRVAEVD